jgi:branched-chain amino acid transport system substrate-binding protein
MCFRELLRRRGGQVVQKVLTPFGTTDFAPYLVGLKEADFIWAFYADRESIGFINQYYEFGLNKKMPIMGGQGGVTTPAVIKAVGDKAIGVYVGCHTPPFGALPGKPETEKFAATFQQKYGVPAGPMAYTGYQQAQCIARAAAAINGNIEDTPRFLQAMKALNFEGLCGPVKFEPGYNWGTCNIFTFKVIKKEGQFGFELLATHKDVGPSFIAPYRGKSRKAA